MLERQKLDSRALRGGELMLHLVLIKHGWDKSVTLRFILPEAEGEACAAYVDENSLAEHPAEPEAQPWKLAALNYNTSRTPGAAYDESTDGKLGSVYTALTEKLIARGDWKR